MRLFGLELGTKQRSIEDLARAGDVPGLVDALRYDPSDARAAQRAGVALHTLVHLDIEVVKAALLRALEDRNPTVRRGAIMALAGRGGEDVNAALTRRLDDPDHGNRDLARWALTGETNAE